MADPNEQLVRALRDVDFDERYYGFYERIRNRTAPSGLNKPDWEKALAETGVPFRYNSKERFFVTEKKVGSCTAAFDVTFRHDEVGLGLGVKTSEGWAAGPFPLLAYSVGVSRDPGFSPQPPYPTLPFSNVEELREVIRFGMSLVEDVERALLSAKLC